MRVTSIAMDYRKKFQKDVIIDFICFRKHGHNELDDPFFTNPKMYKAVRGRDSIPNIYANNIVVWNNAEHFSLFCKCKIVLKILFEETVKFKNIISRKLFNAHFKINYKSD